jgi:hypothetical protein
MTKLKTQITRLAGLALLAITLVTGTAWAQESQLRLSLRKDWGFSMGSQVQGLFSLALSGGPELASARFDLDGEEMASLEQPPFKLQFSTDKYPAGWHKLSATARAADGRTLTSNTISVEFVSAQAGGQMTQRLIIPLLALVLVAMILGLGGQFFLEGRDKRPREPGAPRHYGMAGGALCPKCGRPFARHLFAPNMLLGKLERCPYCRQWSIVPAASPAALAAAEAAETRAAEAQAVQSDVPEPGPEEKLRQQIEDSRYQ